VPYEIQTPDRPTCSTSLIQNKVQALIILIKSTSDTSDSIWMIFPASPVFTRASYVPFLWFFQLWSRFPANLYNKAQSGSKLRDI